MATHNFFVFGGSLSTEPEWVRLEPRGRAVAAGLLGMWRQDPDAMLRLANEPWPDTAKRALKAPASVPALRDLSVAQLHDLAEGRVVFQDVWRATEAGRAVLAPGLAAGLRAGLGTAAEGFMRKLRDISGTIDGVDGAPARRFIAFLGGGRREDWSGSPPARRLEVAVLAEILRGVPDGQGVLDRFALANPSWRGVAGAWPTLEKGVRQRNVSLIDYGLCEATRRMMSAPVARAAALAPV